MNTANNNNNNNIDDFDNNPTNNNHENNERSRIGKGQRKISIEKIENKASLQVTFSKRRTGVFKKASELSTLCGAETALVVFSPGNRPYCFGHPSVESVANRYLNNTNNNGTMQGNAASHLVMAHGEAAINQCNHHLGTIEAKVERERKSRKQLDDEITASVNQLNYEQLEHLKNSVEAKLKGNAGESSSWANPGTHQNQGLGYGAANIPGGSSFAPNGYPIGFGDTLPYPPTGPSSLGFNYENNGVDRAAVDPYDGMWRASGSGSGTRNTNENPPTDEHRDDPPHSGYGGNYGYLF